MLSSHPATSIRIVAMAATVFAVTIAPLRAQTAVSPATPSAAPAYALSVWASEKGLPPGDVFAVNQDAEGYLWLGTPSGLLRFDGSHFASWASINDKEPLPNGPVHALVSAHDGSLWVGLGGGGGIVRIVKGHLTRFGPQQGAPPGVNAMLEDRQGVVWAASRRGLFRFADGRWTAAGKDEGYPAAEAFAVFEDRSGALWVGTAAGVYRRSKTTFELVNRDKNVQSLAEDASGALWVTDSNSVIRRLNDEKAPHADASVRLPASGWRLLGDRRGQVWVAAFGGGLLRLSDANRAAPAIERFPYEQRLAGSPRSLFEDHDGNVWVGMRGGLLRLSEASFDTNIPLEGLTHDGVRSTAVAGDGSVWAATGHSLNRFASGGRTVYNVSQATAIHTDARGSLWVATSQGVGRMLNGRFVPEPITPSVEMSRVLAITTDSRNVLWLCSALKGVMAWDGRALTRFEQQPDVFNRGCLSMANDSRDRVWIGFQGGEVALFDRGRFQIFGERDGLVPGLVLGFLEDKSGAVWVATAGGLSRFQNGRFTALTQANAPLVDLVPVLVEDDEGYIWVGVNSGVAVIRFHPREMDRVASNPSYHIEYALYDETDGLQQSPLTWQSGVGAVRAPDGRLWLTSGAGLAVIDPRHLPHVRRPAAPRVEAVVVDGRTQAPGTEVSLPSRTATLRIQYGSVSLSSASKLRYRYQLEGYDNDWVYAGQRRDVTYANLPSNQYRFRVSTTHDGQWTEAGVWGFAVAPPFYRTRWFISVVALGLTLLLALAWWLRMRALRQRYALVFAERARVSREIHDTLLQSLAAMGVEIEAIASQLDQSQGPARDELRRLRRQVGHSLRDARESILELRRDSMKTPDVVDSLRDVAERTERTYGVRVAISVNGRRQPNCSSDVDLQLFRIGQEAITNAIRHGHATEVRIVVNYEKDRVRLSVCDNGCGFAPDEQLPAREAGEHFGLLTMRERAARISGRLEIVSSPGAGTTVETLIPVPAE
ncbi:MAG TPA: two-component regulator propeller domain-containing protein [Vicinamibacterales bacterium]|jgi:signal transduction histidine kinase|nr:two-component regulator propeller domain-containing protein [Vicinamibacterales bacterium]